MNALPFANYIQSNGIGTVGRDIFLYNMPDSINVGILFTSSLSGTKIDHELPNYRKRNFQIIVRSDNYVDGLAISESIMGVLDFANTDVDNYFVKFVRPRTEPVVYPVSEGDYIEFSLNFETVFIIN
jgi:hypothetical protein